MVEHEDDGAGSATATATDSGSQAPVSDAAQVSPEAGTDSAQVDTSTDAASSPDAAEVSGWEWDKYEWDVDWEQDDWVSGIPEQHRPGVTKLVDSVRKALTKPQAALTEAEKARAAASQRAADLEELYASALKGEADPRIAQSQAQLQALQARLAQAEAQAEAEAEYANAIYVKAFDAQYKDIKQDPAKAAALRELYSFDQMTDLMVAAEVVMRGPKAVELAKKLLSSGLREEALVDAVSSMATPAPEIDMSQAIDSGTPAPVEVTPRKRSVGGRVIRDQYDIVLDGMG